MSISPSRHQPIFGVSVARSPAAVPQMRVDVAPAKRVEVSELSRGVLAGDRAALARAISLIESTSPRHVGAAEELLRTVLARSGTARRIGVTGVPGAGKSTFIERLGLMLCERGERVAVLAIDPSSTISGGSILGDRTRMGRLAGHERAFIRPSPSGGSLGGVARRTRETSLVCEAAGFTIVLIETVGVGQSETMVAEMVDCVLTLALPGSGDELQGVKRGLLELVDVIAVNKCDGSNAERGRRAATELKGAVRVLRAAERIAVIPCSAVTGEGIEDVWQAVEARLRDLHAEGRFEAKRRDQLLRWMHSLIDERLRCLLLGSPAARAALEHAESGVRSAALTPSAGADLVMQALLRDLRGGHQA